MKKVFLLVSVVVGLLICVSANVEAAPGQIIMYSGAWNFDGTGLGTGTLEGWALCNGLNGTPNLKDKFVYATTASAQLGGTGGTTSHTHGMGKREVRFGPDSATMLYGSAAIGWRMTCGPGAPAYWYLTYSATNWSVWNYTSSNDPYNGIYPYLQTRDGSITDSADTIPSYYKLAFIMKR